MSTPAGQFERGEPEVQVNAIVRELLEELGSPQAADVLRGSTRLAQDLGLGSLERVELLVRLERSLGARLPEQVIAEAESLDEVTSALREALAASPAAATTIAPSAPFPGPVSSTAQKKAPVPESAETWQEVLQYRAKVNGSEPHLFVYEGSSSPRPGSRPGPQEDPQVLSFADLFTGAQAIAAALAHRGIGAGDNVALMLRTGRDFYLSFAGVLLAGGVPVPIYPPVRADRIAEYASRQSAILRNAEARLLITFHEASRAAKLLQPQVPSLQGIVTAQELQKGAAAQPNARAARGRTPQAHGDDLALLQYTSGSTDAPKGVQLSHRNLLASVKGMGEAVQARAGDVCVSWLPLYHDMGLIGMWLAPLYFGLPVAVLSPLAFLSRPESWLLALHRHRGTITAAPNFAFELAARKIADRDIEGIDLSCVRSIMNGAEPVVPATLERFASRFAPYGLRREALTPVYGLAEASLGVAIPPPGRGPLVDRIGRESFEREGRALPVSAKALEGDGQQANVLTFVSVGQPLAKHEVRIVDGSGHEAADRSEGTLWFRGPATTRGYYRNEAASRALFPAGREAGWLTSGDRAYRAGNEIFITGRVKDIILKGGRNLYPQEIEEIAARVPGVRKGCVVAFGVPDAASGTERLVIVAETREHPGAGPETIRAQITEQVASAIGMPPDAVELLPGRRIPKTSSGKVRRSQTRQRYLQGRLQQAQAPIWLQVSRLAASGAILSAGRQVIRGLRRMGEVLYGIYAWMAFVAVLLPAWVAVHFARTPKAARHVTVTALRVLLRVIGCRVRVRGREHLAIDPPVVLVCNHTSNFDVIVLMAILGVNYHFVAKGEILRWPFFGSFLKKMGHFAFNRSDSRERMRQSDQILDTLRRGESVFIFPEGTFAWERGVRPFQLGAFKAAAYTGNPILPLALRGTRQFLREGAYLPRPSRISITVGAPLRPKRTTEWREIVRLRDAARAAIQQESGEPLL